jgi:hypothetical protein
MPRKAQPQGFSAAGVILVLLVIAAVALTGWYVYRQNHKSKTPVSNSQTTNTTTNSTSTIPSDWTWYENQDMGLKFAYPSKTWTVGTPTPSAATNGHDGLSISVQPIGPQNGDPSVNISSFPAAANVKDVDFDPPAVKVMSLTTGDGQEVTLAGGIGQPSAATKPTSMGLTSCWPRACPLRLKGGRFLSMNMAGINNNCTPHVACITELNTSSPHYTTALDILKTVTSL